MNKSGGTVRQRARPADRRVARTQRALVHALVGLVLEKRYDAITIQDLLDRADVGRSTFYAHYRGKDDLLLRSFQAMLAMLDQEIERDGTAGGRVAAVRELFRHVDEAREFHRALKRARMLDRVYQAGMSQLSATIGRRIAALPRRPGDDALPVPVVAQALAGALLALLRWWVEEDSPYDPERMDDLYHAIVMPRLPAPRSCGP
jgi:AcrR family transcriptional regulator